MQDGYKDHLKLLQWIAALVLLVACANIANLLLNGAAAALNCRFVGTEAQRVAASYASCLQKAFFSPAWAGHQLAVSTGAHRAPLALVFPNQPTCRSMPRLRRWSSALPLRFRSSRASSLACASDGRAHAR